MANIFDSIAESFAKRIAAALQDPRSQDYNILGNYYAGNQRKQIRTVTNPKTGTVSDDNIIQNFVGLAVDRSTSRLFRGGVTFNLPEGADKQQEYIDRVWDLNKQQILLYQLGLHGAVYGTTYVKISPDGVDDPYSDTFYPRLIAIDPEIIRVRTDPQDMNDVEEYRIEYKIVTNGQETAYREITRKSNQQDYAVEPVIVGSETLDPATDVRETWMVEHWQQVGSAAWQMIGKTEWPYDFPPILHWKNLPSLKSCYGDSDIDDAINVQDKNNFVVSNTGKIIKYHANPQTIGTGFSAKNMESLDSAVGVFHAITNPDAKVFNLEMNSDLASSRQFANDMRQSIFDIAREVDISSVKDKIGQLTNLGLQVLWGDAIDKNDTKRQLYGDALQELNRRLLVLAGFEGPASNPGEIKWGDAFPINTLEEMQVDDLALTMGIVDKGTVAERYKSRYGKSWDDIQAAIADDKSSQNQNNTNIGGLLLNNFTKNIGSTPPKNMPSAGEMIGNMRPAPMKGVKSNLADNMPMMKGNNK